MFHKIAANSEFVNIEQLLLGEIYTQIYHIDYNLKC